MNSTALYMELFRREITDEYCIGELYIDGKWFCYTLEDPPRDVKIPGRTGIPAGHYHVKVDYSPRFKRNLPRLIAVPGFEGIRIHPGNTKEDTEGCILVGEARGKDRVLRSRMAFNSLYDKLYKATRAGRDLEIEIREDDRHDL